MKNSKKGFTLIELLVVVSIIGLLASIVVVSLGGSRVQSRDTKRVADLRQMQQAYELCYNDLACATASMNDYPPAGPDGACAGVKGYMSESPKDPLGAGDNVYKCFSIPQRYCMSAKMEGADPAKAWVWVTPQGTETGKGAGVTAATLEGCK